VNDSPPTSLNPISASLGSIDYADIFGGVRRCTRVLALIPKGKGNARLPAWWKPEGSVARDA